MTKLPKKLIKQILQYKNLIFYIPTGQYRDCRTPRQLTAPH